MEQEETMVVGGPAAQPLPSRVVTLPNGLSVARLLGVPLFFWCIVEGYDGWAIVILAVSGATDYFDGLLARRLNQQSRLGELLDPSADRLYILATLIGLTWRDLVPLWLTLALVIRDILLTAALGLLFRRGYGPLPVHYLGKAATLCLLYAFPLILLGAGDNPVADFAGTVGWAFAIWGTALYWWAALLYVTQVRSLLVTRRGPATAPDLLGVHTPKTNGRPT